MLSNLKHNFIQLLISLDQVINVVLCMCFNTKAWADETMSAHAYRLAKNGHSMIPMNIIDTLFWFQSNHCYSAYESERTQKQLPLEERE